MQIFLFRYTLDSEHFGYIYLLVIISRAAINISVQIPDSLLANVIFNRGKYQMIMKESLLIKHSCLYDKKPRLSFKHRLYLF